MTLDLESRSSKVVPRLAVMKVYFTDFGDLLCFDPAAFIEMAKLRLTLGTDVVNIGCQPLKDVFIYGRYYDASVKE